MNRNFLVCAFTVRSAAATLVIAVAVVLVLGSLLSGCSSSDTVKPKEPTLSLLPRTSPENVLYDFRSLYDGADYFVKTVTDTLHWDDMYQSLFHPDTFTFYFRLYDEPPWLLHPWWGLTEELHSFRSILRHKALGAIRDVKLSWTVYPSEPDLRYDLDTQDLLHPTWRHVYVTDILLDVTAGGINYRVPDSCADFYLAPDPANPSLWVITEWWDCQSLEGTGSQSDRASLAEAGIPPTWGDIKGLFY